MADTSNTPQGGAQTDRSNPNPNPGPSKTPTSPTQQRPPTDNERKSGSEQSEKEHRSNLAGDQDVDEPVETEEGKPAEGHA